MKFRILHETKERMRVHMIGERISCEQADILLYYLHNIKEIQAVKVYDRTADVTISYIGERADIIHILRRFQYENVKVPNGLLENSGRELNNTYQEKLIGKVISHYARKLLLPYPLQACYTTEMCIRDSLKPCLCEINIPFWSNSDVLMFFQIFYGNTDTGLGKT